MGHQLPRAGRAAGDTAGVRQGRNRGVEPEATLGDTGRTWEHSRAPRPGAAALSLSSPCPGWVTATHCCRLRDSPQRSPLAFFPLRKQLTFAIAFQEKASLLRVTSSDAGGLTRCAHRECTHCCCFPSSATPLSPCGKAIPCPGCAHTAGTRLPWEHRGPW